MNDVQRACMTRRIFDRLDTFTSGVQFPPQFRDLYRAISEYDILPKTTNAPELLKKLEQLE